MEMEDTVGNTRKKKVCTMTTGIGVQTCCSDMQKNVLCGWHVEPVHKLRICELLERYFFVLSS